MTKSLEPSHFPGLSRRDLETDVDLPARVADLAVTFPLLFFMLASDSGSFARRLETIRLAELGKPLPEVAAAYRLPLCLRRIQPEACVALVPWVSWSKRAARLLANHVPEQASEAAPWLSAVFHAARICNEEFALWIAGQRQFSAGRPFDCNLLQPLALFAWHSCQTINPLKCITVTPWSPKLGLTRAIEETEAWLMRLHLLAHCGSYPIADTWLEPGRVGGYDFVPLVTWDGLTAERIAMRNCLHTYVDKLANGACRLFAVKAGDRSVATLEIVFDGAREFRVNQLKGPGNSSPSLEIRDAARMWVQSQQGRTTLGVQSAPIRQSATRLSQLMAPYRQAIGAPHGQAISSASSLRETLNQFRRRFAGVNLLPATTTETGQSREITTPIAASRSVEHLRVHAALRAQFGEEVYRSWFVSIEFKGCDAGVVRASIPFRFVRNWVQSHYMDDLRACCAEVWGHVERVDLVHRAFASDADTNAHPAASGITIARVLIDGGEGSQAVTIEDILTLVARHYRVTRADILSQRRHRTVVFPRQIAMYLARQLSPRGLPEIGRRFGGRDTTTVLHAIRKIDSMMSEDPRFRDVIADLRRQLTADPRPAA